MQRIEQSDRLLTRANDSMRSNLCNRHHSQECRSQDCQPGKRPLLDVVNAVHRVENPTDMGIQNGIYSYAENEGS